jgi:hypothetical protein
MSRSAAQSASAIASVGPSDASVSSEPSTQSKLAVPGKTAGSMPVISSSSPVCSIRPPEAAIGETDSTPSSPATPVATS